MAISSEVQESLKGDHPEAWVRHLIESFPPEYFQVFGAKELSAHLGMLQNLRIDQPIRLSAIQRIEDNNARWRLTIVGYDVFMMLSTICSLLTIKQLSIVNAEIFTSSPTRRIRTSPPNQVRSRAQPYLKTGLRRKPIGRGSHDRHEPDLRPKIVDVFEVAPFSQSNRPDWSAIEEELSELCQLLRLGQHDEVQHRLFEPLAEALASRPLQPDRLNPIELEITPDPETSQTRITVETFDRFGFLSITTSALALSGLRIVRGEVRTDAASGLVRDSIWITDRAGEQINDSDRLITLKHAISLIESFSVRLPLASDPEAALVHFSRFANDLMARPDRAEEYEALQRPEVLDGLARVLGESRFLWEDFLLTQPQNVLPLICNPERWKLRVELGQLDDELNEQLRSASSEDERVQVLRRFKDRELFRADVRTILGLSDGAEGFAAELTDLAEVVVKRALELAVNQLCSSYPKTSTGDPVPLVIAALGKFGARELGFASDLELMVVWDDRNAVSPNDRTLTDIFDRLIVQFRQVLGIRQGATFEPDFRLRPHGRGGPQATPLTLFQSYYRPKGPAWNYERQALIRFRTIAGDQALATTLNDHRTHFVYSDQPFDFEALRSMRRLQLKQLIKPGKLNAKYSPGGLVDIEYSIQAVQIFYGRHEPRLRTTNTREAMAISEQLGIFPMESAIVFHRGYSFARELTSALRVVRGNAADLTVPAWDSSEFRQLARRLRRPDPESLRREIEKTFAETQSVIDPLLNHLAKIERSHEATFS